MATSLPSPPAKRRWCCCYRDKRWSSSWLCLHLDLPFCPGYGSGLLRGDHAKFNCAVSASMANYRKSTQGVAHRRCHLSAFDARSINCDSQTPRPAWCEACVKIQKSRNVKKRFIQSADTDASTSSQRSKAIDSVADSFQAFKNRAAAARARYEARKISRAVADERHGCAVKSRENNLPGLAIGQRLPSRGIDDFKEEISLAQVVSHVRCAIHAAAQSHFGHSVVLKDFATGS